MLTTDSTVIAALMHYGLTCYDGSHCVDALADLGHDKASEVLAAALLSREAACADCGGIDRHKTTCRWNG